MIVITIAHRTTRRTSLAGAVGGNPFDANTNTFGFERDELLALVGVPRMNAWRRAVLADALEVFQPNDGFFEMFREPEKTTGEVVAQISDSTLFFVIPPVTCGKRTHFQKRVAQDTICAPNVLGLTTRDYTVGDKRLNIRFSPLDQLDTACKTSNDDELENQRFSKDAYRPCTHQPGSHVPSKSYKIPSIISDKLPPQLERLD